jgi:hypothetical protein
MLEIGRRNHGQQDSRLGEQQPSRIYGDRLGAEVWHPRRDLFRRSRRSVTQCRRAVGGLRDRVVDYCQKTFEELSNETFCSPSA